MNRAPTSSTTPGAGAPRGPVATPWLPSGVDLPAAAIVLGAWLLLYLPTYWDLAHGIWANEEQSYGPVILAASAWLMWQDRAHLAALPARQRPAWAYALVVLALLMYALGRSQNILMFEVGSQIPLLAAILLLFKGTAALRPLWVPLLLLVFMVPLPGDLVAAVTAPLKSAVSAVAAQLLYWAGYPVARTGVILSVGQYQLLVADACAGLSSMFTLEALGLIYMKLMGYTNAWRNSVLAVLLIPVAFAANVIRVVVLVLVTYHFGDEAGQGFVHSAAGLVLFVVATMLMVLTDRMLGLTPALREQRAPATP